MKKSNFLFIGILILISTSTKAYVTKSGNVSGEYWHNTDTYYVSGDLTVDDGTTLEIQAGTRVKFAPSTRLTVYGTLIANGNSSSNIFFTSRDDDEVGEIITGSDGNPSPGDWEYITINGNGDNNGIATFNFCHVRYGGSGSYGNIYFYDSNSPTFTNSSVAYSSSFGIRMNSGIVYFENSDFAINNNHGIYSYNGEPHIDNCLFTDNGGYAAYLNNVNVKTYTGNTGSGNNINAFGISGTIDQDITLSQSITGFPYVLHGSITVNDNVTLTILPGEIIKATGPNTRFIALGTIYAQGSETQKIVFTSLQDDTFGGDLNGDDDATSPAPGNWAGLYLFGNGDDDGKGFFNHCIVRYAGTGANSYSAVYFSSSDSAYIKNSIVEYSQYEGIESNHSDVVIENCSINNNGTYGMYLVYGTPQINNCQINSNGEYAAYLNNVNVKIYTGNTGSGNTINAFGIGGTIDQDITLSQSITGFPYVLHGSITVNDNVTLTIPPGEIIKATGPNTRFIALGTINAQGSETQKIVFTSLQDDTFGGDLNGDGDATSPAPSDWAGLYMSGISDNDGNGYFDHCIVRYAGTGANSYAGVYFNAPDSAFIKNSIIEYGQYEGIEANHSKLVVENCVINNNGSHGIYINYGKPEINNCQFNNNDSYAAYLTSVDIISYTNNSGTGNTINAFGISGKVKQDLTLSQSMTGFPFVLVGDVTVYNNCKLTIPPGEIIKLTGSTTGILSQGTIDAQGTNSQPIIFTSLLDDSFGGDLNGDGDATSPTPGNWEGILLNGSSDNDGNGFFDHCVIRYGGISNNSYSAINFNQSDSAFILNSVVEYGLYDGLRSYYSSVLIKGNTFNENTRYGLTILGTTVPNLGQNNLSEAGLNTFINNDGGGIQLYSSSNSEINAYYNDWGFYTEAEIDAHIYDDDEGSSGEVHFNPWYDPASPPIEAGFGADTLLGRAPFSVQFYDSTLLESNSWHWDFEDDGTIDATGQNPNMDFMQEGLYSVKLTASNGINDDILVRQNYINVSGVQSSQALHFDGIDDFLKVDGIPFPADDHTIEAWIYPTSLNGFHEVVFFYDNFGGVQFRIHDNASLLYGEAVSGSWDFVISPPNSFEINTWTHVAVTKQGDNCNLFINGINVGFSQFDNNPVPDTMSIGGRSKYMDRLFEGNIDELRIWTVARTQIEIQASISNYLTGDETGLYIYYRNNEGLGQTTFDLSDQVFHGQLGSTSIVDTSDPVWVPTNWPYEATFKLDLKAFLEGPFNGSGMNTDLHEMLPLVQPYNVNPWDYDGTETYAGTYDNTNIVDWMLVEFRDAPDAASATTLTPFDQQAAFILEDGRIVGIDGSSNLRFNHFLSEQLFISMIHRNHIAVLSANPVPNNSIFFNYDFTSAAEQAYGIDALTDLGNNSFGMIGGDGNADGIIDISDKTAWEVQAGKYGYFSGDFTMDGQVQNNDKNEVWTSTGIPTIQLPNVTTTGITDISQTIASGGGNVTNNGGAMVTARGICWGLNSNPTLANEFTSDGSGLGSFTSSLSGLNPDTEYFVRAYATNSEGTAFGNEVSFSTLEIYNWLCGDTIVDARDGKIYNTVLIDNQCWMAENLNIGTMINVTTNQENTNTIEKYCYDDNISNCETYGGLYQWNEAMSNTTISGTQGICPEGWHLPSTDEWNVLISFVSNDGNSLKAVGQGTNLGAGTNTSGFSALLVGSSYQYGFENINTETSFWTSTNQTYSFAYRNTLSDEISEISGGTSIKSKGFSIRCIKD